MRTFGQKLTLSCLEVRVPVQPERKQGLMEKTRLCPWSFVTLPQAQIFLSCLLSSYVYPSSTFYSPSTVHPAVLR